jgi:hypothetical protein
MMRRENRQLKLAGTFLPELPTAAVAALEAASRASDAAGIAGGSQWACPAEYALIPWDIISEVSLECGQSIRDEVVSWFALAQPRARCDDVRAISRVFARIAEFCSSRSSPKKLAPNRFVEIGRLPQERRIPAAPAEMLESRGLQAAQNRASNEPHRETSARP